MPNKFKTIIKRLFELYFVSFKQNNRKISSKPTEVYISVTENCCLECKMCNIWKIKDKQKPLNYKTGKEIIDRLSKWLGIFNITFAGGEPFLNKDVLKLIEYASKKNIKTSTNSNGYIVDRKLAQKISKSGLSTIFFSVDGLEKEHDYIRGKKESFKRVIKAIKYIQSSKSTNKPKVYINTVISKNNIAIITKLIDLAHNLKVKGINFQSLMPNFASIYKDQWWKENKLWPKEKKVIINNLEKLKRYKDKYGDFILNSKDNLNKFEEYFLDPKKFQENEKCFVGLNNLMADSVGNIKLCYEMENIGNIFEEKPEKIWYGIKAKKVRNKISKCKRPCKLLPCNLSYFQNILKIRFYKMKNGFQKIFNN